jgi:glycerol uptake facilitator-like aquaporin
VPVAGGLALTVLAASLGHGSGAHLNPAVTLGLAVNRRFPWAYAPGVRARPVRRGYRRCGGHLGLYGSQARSRAYLGATYPAAGAGPGRVFAAEAVVTFVLILVIISVATDRRVPRSVAAMAIGAALAVAILIGGPISGAGANPARAIGPMILAGRFTDWWACLIAPLIGDALAVTAYDQLPPSGSLSPGSWPVTAA